MPGSDGKPDGKFAKGASKIVGDYELFAMLGKGGMGSVYKARHVPTGRVVAFKVLPPSNAERPDLVGRFRREVRILLGLEHENIVRGIDSGRVGNLHYLVMEYVEGQSVSGALTREGRFDDKETLRIMFDVARALAYAHSKGLIHRDVKPQNILMDPDGVIKLCDLGLARAEADTGFTVIGTKLGTPKYMSPEQVAGTRSIDARADVYSLGATAYHMLTGSVPYDAASGTVIMAKQVSGRLTPVRQMVSGADPGLAAVIELCLEKKPEDRYQSMAELCADLRLIASDKPPEKAKVDPAAAPGRKAGRVDRSARGRGRKRGSSAARLVWVLIVLAALLAAGAWALFWGPLKEYGDAVKERLAPGSGETR